MNTFGRVVYINIMGSQENEFSLSLKQRFESKCRINGMPLYHICH